MFPRALPAILLDPTAALDAQEPQNQLYLLSWIHLDWRATRLLSLLRRTCVASFMPFSSVLRRPVAYTAIPRIQCAPSRPLGLTPITLFAHTRNLGIYRQQSKVFFGSSFLLPSALPGFKMSESKGRKQATLGYVQDSQLTLGCVARTMKPGPFNRYCCSSTDNLFCDV